LPFPGACMWAMLCLVVVTLTMGLAGGFTGTCRHIALVQSLCLIVGLLLVTLGHYGKGSSAGFDGLQPFYCCAS
jgi:hypothetical protein